MIEIKIITSTVNNRGKIYAVILLFQKNIFINKQLISEFNNGDKILFANKLIYWYTIIANVVKTFPQILTFILLNLFNELVNLAVFGNVHYQLWGHPIV